MKATIVATLLAASSVNGFVPVSRVQSSTRLTMSDSANMFGGGPATTLAVPPTDAAGDDKPAAVSSQQQSYMDRAARMRQEAAEMEIALREEGRAKGLPEELINKLVPPPRMASADKAASSSSVASSMNSETPTEVKLLSSSDLRAKLGYLNSGDAVRFTSELDRVKANGNLRVWNSHKLDSRPNFSVSNGQLTSRTKIDPIKLRLDDVGYDYQKVFVTALVIGTVFGLGSSTIGGETGFILGYLSALLPIALVGVGSVAPALIFDVLSAIKYATDDAARDRYAHMQAGKFLVAYALGLPVARFDAGGPASKGEFFQLRPTGKSEKDDKSMFNKKSFSQAEIAAASAMCLGGPVAECMIFGDASGKNPADVNTLNEIMGRVEPTMTTEMAQNHIRWSAMTAHDILTNNKEHYLKLVEAMKAGLPLEECIAALESIDAPITVPAAQQ